MHLYLVIFPCMVETVSGYGISNKFRQNLDLNKTWLMVEPWIQHIKLTTYDIKATLLLYCVDLYKCKRVICCTEQKYKGETKVEPLFVISSLRAPVLFNKYSKGETSNGSIQKIAKQHDTQDGIAKATITRNTRLKARPKRRHPSPALIPVIK